MQTNKLQHVAASAVELPLAAKLDLLVARPYSFFLVKKMPLLTEILH